MPSVLLAVYYTVSALAVKEYQLPQCGTTGIRKTTDRPPRMSKGSFVGKRPTFAHSLDVISSEYLARLVPDVGIGEAVDLVELDHLSAHLLGPFVVIQSLAG